MNKAFTLIEFLIYIGIVGVLLIAAGAVAVNIFFDKAKLSAIEETNQNARLIMEKITERIRSAEAINSPTQGSSAVSLSLAMSDVSKNPTVFDLSNGVLRIKEGSGSEINLTSDEITIYNLQFTNISYTDTPGTVRVEFTANYNNPQNRQEYSANFNFKSSASVRVALGIPVTPTPTPTPTCSPQANTLVINTSGASIGGSGNRDLVGMTVANTSSSCILVIDKITTTWNNSRNINSIVINGITVWTGSASSGTQLDIQDYTLNPNSGTIPITRFGFSGNMKNTTFNITFIMKDVSSKSTGNFSP